MRFRSLSLGARLNLSLLAFVLLLGLATAAIVLYGANRTRNDATARSRTALEEEGQLALKAVVGGASASGGLRFETVAEIGQRSARYIDSLNQEAPPPPYDTSRLQRTAEGVYYDPDPNRTSDLVILNGSTPADDAVKHDLAFSSALNAIFPTLLEGFAGEVGGENLDPIAIVFISINGVSRYYPPVGIHEALPPNVDLSDRMQRLGPANNPTRATIWTSPYADAAGQGQIITARTPVYEGDTFRGSMEVDLSTGRIIDEINGIHPTPSGFAFYVDSSGNLWQSNAFDLLNQQRTENEDLAALFEAMKASGGDSDVVVQKLVLNDEEFFIAYAPMLSLGGSFAVAAPVSEITAEAADINAGIQDEANRTLLVVLAAMGALFVASLVAATYINRRVLVAPIKQLASATQAVAAGDLDTKVTLDRDDELGSLGESFNRMVDRLRESELVLERRVEERTGEVGALLEVSRSVTSTLALEPLMEALLDSLRSVIEYDGAGISLREGNMMRQLAVRRPPGYSTAPDDPEHDDTMDLTSEAYIALRKGESIVIGDTHDDSEGAGTFRRSWGGDLGSTAASYIRSLAIAPLKIRDELSGLLSVAKSEPGYFTERHLDLLQAVADQAASAIENARLFEETERRTRETTALLEVSRVVASSLALSDVLGAILDHLGAITEHTGASIVLFRDDAFEFAEARSITGTRAQIGARVPFAVASRMAADLKRGETVIIDDVRSDEPLAADYRAIIGAIGVPDQPPFSVIRSWMAVPLALKDRVLGALTISWTAPAYFTADHARLAGALADQAALALENARLYEEMRRSAREYEVLSRADTELFQSLDLDSVLQALVDVTVDVLGVDKSIVTTWDVDARVMTLRAWRNFGDPALTYIRSLFDRRTQSLDVPRVIVTEDASRAEPHLVPIIESEGLRSLIEIPVVSRDGRPLGFFSVAYTTDHHFDEAEQRLLTALAERAAVAIENARQLDETKKRARETEALFRADAELFQSLDLDGVLQALVDVIVDIVGADRSMVATWSSSEPLRLRTAPHQPPEALAEVTAALESLRSERERVLSAGVIVMEGIESAHPLLQPVWEREGIQAVIEVPIMSSARVLLGAFTVTYMTRHSFSTEEQRLLIALAERAAVAIENAELYQRAQLAASLEERQRLARELHDSVSQALYGIALGARTAQTLLERDPAKASEPVDYVLSLAEAGMAEMRALIFELRPESLESEGLSAAIRKQVEAVQARHGIPVAFETCEEPDLPLPTKEAAYRIAQEALTNVVKHSGATEVRVTLSSANGTVMVQVADNGSGFDAAGEFPGHLGLHSMRERTEKAGGKFGIDSDRSGTRIQASFSL